MEVTSVVIYLPLNKNKNIQELIEKLGLIEASSLPTPMTGTCLTKTCMIT